MYNYFFICLVLTFGMSLPCLGQSISFDKVDGMVSLFDHGRHILSYQVDTKSHQGQYPRANYIHPLNDFEGSPLTEDFPEDHLHQRGIFWTWHQLHLNGKSLADPWICEGIQWQVGEVETQAGAKKAQMKTAVKWMVDEIKNPLVEEQVSITYLPGDEYYSVDFNIVLQSLLEGVELGGSDDNKGYGGFSARLMLGDKVSFEDSSGKVAADNEQVHAGNWMLINDIGGNGVPVAIMYHPSATASLQGWILREKGSMQNPVWPGRERYVFKKGEQITIKARVVVFKGQPDAKKINKIYQQYVKK